ncbi:MAG: RAD55 family ATPase [Candidatus Hodarchaeota archaeon]
MSNENQHIKCELEAINTLLGGGLRRGTTCLLEEFKGEKRGVTGLLGTSFLHIGLQEGEGAIFLLSEHTVQEYLLLPPVKRLMDESKSHQWLFMDGLSSLSYREPSKPPEENVIRCSNIRYSAKFYEEFRRVVKRFKLARVFVDSLSVLLHAMESDRAAWQFWLALLPLIHRRKLTVIGAFYPEMHTSQFTESIERLSNSIIRFSASTPQIGENPVRQIQIAKNRGRIFSEKIHVYERKGFEYYIKD